MGFKPTFDLVPTEGCFPLAASFDHVGPMARSVEDCERMLAALVPGFTPEDVSSLDDVRVGVALTELADPLVRARVEDAAGRFPDSAASAFALPSDTELSKLYNLFRSEVADVHRELYTEQGELYGSDVAAKIEACLALTEAELAGAPDARERYREQCLETLDGADLLVTPTIPCVAPRAGIGDATLRPILIRFTFPFNALGWPALALPCGAAEDGLPASIQLAGPPGSDGLVLAAGRALSASLV